MRRGRRQIIPLLFLLALAGAASAGTVTPKEVVVIGGGPAGLAAALELKRAGAQGVIVLEKRKPERTRFQRVMLDLQTLVNLKNLGVDTSLASGIYPVRGIYVDHDTAEGRRFVPWAEMPESLAGESRADFDHLLVRRATTAVARIASLEHALLAACEKNGIEVVHEADVTAIEQSTDRVEVTYQRGAVAKQIPAEALVVADGANSAKSGALKLLGVAPRPMGKVKSTLFFPVRHGPLDPSYQQGGEIDVRIAQTDPERQYHAVRLASEAEAAVGVVLPDDVPRDPATLLRFAEMIAAKIVTVPPTPTRTPVVVSHAPEGLRTPSIGERVFVIGDAAFSGTSILGVYANIAIHDATRVARLYRGLREHGYSSRAADNLRKRYASERQKLNKQLARQEDLTATLYGHSFGAGGPLSSAVDLVERTAIRAQFSGKQSLLRTGFNLLTDTAAVLAHAHSERLIRRGAWARGNLAGHFARYFDRVTDDSTENASRHRR